MISLLPLIFSNVFDVRCVEISIILHYTAHLSAFKSCYLHWSRHTYQCDKNLPQNLKKNDQEGLDLLYFPSVLLACDPFWQTLWHS